MKIYFVRHGKTQSNLEQKYNGSTDEPLVEEGVNDLISKKKLYNDLEFDYTYCSSLNRCKQTFEILFDNHIVNEYRDDIVEMDFGDWSGIHYMDKFKELEQKGYSWEDFVDPDNGESYESLFNRTTDFLKEIKQKHQNDDNILVVCHGLVIAAIMKKHYLTDKIMYHLAPENGLGYIVEYIDDDVKVNMISKDEI